MPNYRLYKLTAEGRIAVGEWLEAPDLAEAKARGLAMCADQPFRCELWLGADRLAAFPCQTTACAADAEGARSGSPKPAD